MSAGTPPANPSEESTQPPAAAGSTAKPPDHIYLVSYPKIVFLYPTFLFALFAGIYMALAGNAAGEARPGTEFVALVFLGVAAINLIVFSFDFPRATSLTLFFFGAAIVLGLLLLFRLKPDLLPVVTNLLHKLRPWANSHFYFTLAAILGIIYLIVGLTVQFDYWEVRPNELLHHHGLLSDMERFSAPNLRFDKEINDVFEYLLLRSGRLILHPSNEPRAIVLENVFFISRKEQELTKMLGSLQVRLRSEPH